MRALGKILVLAAAVLIAGCANPTASPGGVSPQNPPFPSTPSILPLAVGNSWTYSLTAYDSLGKKLSPSPTELDLAIPGVYGLAGDTQLVALSRENYLDSFDAYVYEYEWDDRDSGALVVYRGSYLPGLRGLYVVGRYRGAQTSLFPAEKLWLAYPADSGTTWRFHPDSADTASAATMEILSTDAQFFAPDERAMTAGRFLSCYLYKETGPYYVSYYYYNPAVGCVGYLSYSGGRLRKSYCLKRFEQ
jgi:hypothetical protein